MILLYIIAISSIIGLVTGIIKGVVHHLFGGIITFLILSLCVFAWYNKVETPQQLMDKLHEVLPKSERTAQPAQSTPAMEVSHNDDDQPDSNGNEPAPNTSQPASEHQILTGNEASSTTVGSVNYGATFVLGDLDSLGRATYAHIRVKDAQEPDRNGVKRPQRILTNPAGWTNPNRTNDRTHLVGYQFSGVNDDPRNLVTATAYLNRGVKKKGSNEKNPDGMLFYEQQLDTWMRQNPDNALDLYVAPNYQGDQLVPVSVTMTWVGVSPNGDLIPIDTGGHAEVSGEFRTVTLENK